MKRVHKGSSHLLRNLVCLVALVLLCGCTVVTEELGESLPPVEQAAAQGATTGQVLDALGPPSQITALNDGYAFLYEHALIRERQLGLSVNYLWLRYFKLALGSAEADREALLLTFGRDGRVSNSAFFEWTEDLGKGNSVQFIIAVMSVVDTGEITETPITLKWGGELLQSRLPESLNRQSSTITGLNGLEQSGTPTGAGQRTLEADTFPVLNLNAY
jgi:hypothetical protein